MKRLQILGLAGVLALAAVALPLACGGADSCEDTATCPPKSLTSAGEDCMNGIDDDGDAQIDCMDAKCTASDECSVPEGWDGYQWVTRTGPDEAADKCADGSDPVTYFRGPEPTSCTPCECNQTQPPTCKPAPISCWGNANCTGNEIAITDGTMEGQCVAQPMTASGSKISCMLTGTADTVGLGVCEVSGGAPENPDGWSEHVHVCGPTTSTTCAAGDDCSPQGLSNSGEMLCIRQDGDQTCPENWPEKIDALTGSATKPSCAACTCQPGGCAGGIYLAHPGDTMCGGPTTVIQLNACSPFTTLNGNWSMEVSTFAPESCTAAGGAPSEDITPTGPVTFCCRTTASAGTP